MENSKLLPLLWILSSVITLTVASYIVVGSLLFIEYSLVAIIAVAGWLRFSYKELPTQNTILGTYLLCIVLLVMLNTARYASDYAGFLQQNYAAWLQTGFKLNFTSWFILLVCLPVSLMLWGGYYLSKRANAGFFFAWWGFAYCLSEAFMQLKVELGHVAIYQHHFFAGTIIAMLLFVLSVSGIIKLIKSSAHHQPIAYRKEYSPREINLWTLIFVGGGVVYTITLFTQGGPLPVIIIVGSMVLGIIGWRKTSARFPLNPYQITPVYLLMMALFYVHVGEEVLTDFSQSIVALSGHPWDPQEFNFLILFIGPVFWFYAAYSLWKGQPFGNFILWFMVVGMILGEPTHMLLFPVIRMVKEGVDYEYFSGMFTALFPMIPAIIALKMLLRTHKEQKNNAI